MGERTPSGRLGCKDMLKADLESRTQEWHLVLHDSKVALWYMSLNLSGLYISSPEKVYFTHLPVSESEAGVAKRIGFVIVTLGHLFKKLFCNYLPLSLINCVALGKLFNLVGPQCSHVLK